MDNFWSDYYSTYGFDKLNIFNELEKALNLGDDLISLKIIKDLNNNKIANEIIEKLENEYIFKVDIVIECLKHKCNFTKEYVINEGINYKKCRYNLSKLIIVASEKRDDSIFNDLNNKKVRRITETNRALYALILRNDILSAYYLIEKGIDFDKFEKYLVKYKENAICYTELTLNLKKFYNKNMRVL